MSWGSAISAAPALVLVHAAGAAPANASAETQGCKAEAPPLPPPKTLDFRSWGLRLQNFSPSRPLVGHFPTPNFHIPRFAGVDNSFAPSIHTSFRGFA